MELCTLNAVYIESYRVHNAASHVSFAKHYTPTCSTTLSYLEGCLFVCYINLKSTTRTSLRAFVSHSTLSRCYSLPAWRSQKVLVIKKMYHIHCIFIKSYSITIILTFSVDANKRTNNCECTNEKDSNSNRSTYSTTNVNSQFCRWKREAMAIRNHSG